MGKVIVAFLLLVSLALAQYQPPIGNSSGGSITINGTTCTVGSSCTVTAGAPTTATYITQTADAGLSAEQAMAALGTGLVKNTTGTGVQSIAVAGTDFVGGQGSLVTVGAVPYVSSSGVLSQDQTAGGQFFWDVTNHRLGIGTNTPGSPLVVKTGSNFLLHNSGGGGGGDIYENTALGYKAGNVLAGTGFGNVLIGPRAGLNLNGTSPAGSANTIVGYNAGELLTTGSYNTLLGAAAGSLMTTQSESTFFGWHAGLNVKGDTNSFFGYASGQGNASTATGVFNVSIGGESFQVFTSGNFNTGLGGRALQSVTSGANNIGIGFQSGDNLTTGSSNIIIGYNIDAPSATENGQMSIGNLIFATGLDGTGTTISSGKVGIGISAPLYGLDVSRGVGLSGTARFYDQTATTGATRVVVSLGAADSATTATLTNAGTTKSAGYQSSDGSAGVTVTTCTGFKNGLCISGT